MSMSEGINSISREMFEKATYTVKCICISNPTCELEPDKCSRAIECTDFNDAYKNERRFMCGIDRCG